MGNVPGLGSMAVSENEMKQEEVTPEIYITIV